MNALAFRLDELARDLGRTRRSLESSGVAWTGGYLIDRLVGHVETLHLLLEPTAADLVRQGLTVEHALALVDARASDLDRLLRGGAR